MAVASRRLVACLPLYFALVVSGESVIAQEGWSEFRGPNGNGVTSTELPVQWSRDSGITWRTELPGSGWSCPVVSGKRVFLTTAIPKDEASAELKKGGEFTLECLYDAYCIHLSSPRYRPAVQALLHESIQRPPPVSA